MAIKNEIYKGQLFVSTALIGGDSKYMEIDANGFIKPASSTDALAPNNSVYYSTDQSKLVYKDSGGSVNDLY